MATKNRRLVLWLLGFVVFISVLTTGAVILLLDSNPVVLNTESQALHIRISPNMTEAPGNEGLLIDPADLPPLTTEVAAAIRVAAQDEQISELFIEIDGLNIGWGQAEELRTAIAAFSSAEKPCTVWAESYDLRSYFVASACTHIAMAPEGLPLVNGMNITQSYYAGTLELLDVEANFEHVGDFKSAVEPYERTGRDRKFNTSVCDKTELRRRCEEPIDPPLNLRCTAFMVQTSKCIAAQTTQSFS